MKKWVEKSNELLNKALRGEINAISVATWMSHSFVVIHPFCDGNGRMSRIILNAVLIAFAEVPFPIVITKGTSKGKKEYIKALRRADEESLFYCNNFKHLNKYVNVVERGILKSFEEIQKITTDEFGEQFTLRFNTPPSK